jgi:hypothetical protein
MEEEKIGKKDDHLVEGERYDACHETDCSRQERDQKHAKLGGRRRIGCRHPEAGTRGKDRIR